LAPSLWDLLATCFPLWMSTWQSRHFRHTDR
jgi:hypothetical protein